MKRKNEEQSKWKMKGNGKHRKKEKPFFSKRKVLASDNSFSLCFKSIHSLQERGEALKAE